MATVETKQEKAISILEMDIRILDDQIKKDTDEIVASPQFSLIWRAEPLYKNSFKRNFLKNVVNIFRDGDNTPEAIINQYLEDIQKRLLNASLMNSTSMMQNCKTVWEAEMYQDIHRYLKQVSSNIEKA